MNRDIRSSVVRESCFSSASPRRLVVRPRFSQEGSSECSETRTDPICVLVARTRWGDAHVTCGSLLLVHPECVEHQNTSAAICVCRWRRDGTILTPLPFQAQSGHTEAYREYQWVLRTSWGPQIRLGLLALGFGLWRAPVVSGACKSKVQLFAWPRIRAHDKRRLGATTTSLQPSDRATATRHVCSCFWIDVFSCCVQVDMAQYVVHNLWFCGEDGHLLSHPIFLHRFRGTSTVVPRWKEAQEHGLWSLLGAGMMEWWVVVDEHGWFYCTSTAIAVGQTERRSAQRWQWRNVFSEIIWVVDQRAGRENENRVAWTKPETGMIVKEGCNYSRLHTRMTRRCRDCRKMDYVHNSMERWAGWRTCRSEQFFQCKSVMIWRVGCEMNEARCTVGFPGLLQRCGRAHLAFFSCFSSTVHNGHEGGISLTLLARCPHQSRSFRCVCREHLGCRFGAPLEWPRWDWVELAQHESWSDGQYASVGSGAQCQAPECTTGQTPSGAPRMWIKDRGMTVFQSSKVGTHPAELLVVVTSWRPRGESFRWDESEPCCDTSKSSWLCICPYSKSKWRERESFAATFVVRRNERKLHKKLGESSPAALAKDRWCPLFYTLCRHCKGWFMPPCVASCCRLVFLACFGSRRSCSTFHWVSHPLSSDLMTLRGDVLPFCASAFSWSPTTGSQVRGDDLKIEF